MKSHRYTDFPEKEENTSEQVRITEDADRIYMARIYNWMAGGLAITGLTAWKISSLMVDPTSIFNRAPGMFLILLILEIILVGVLTALIQKMSPLLAALLFCLFAVLNGMSLAPLFLFYTSASIASAFFACAGMFFVTSLFGYLTRINLGRAGAFCVMGIFGLIIATLINLFLNNSLMETIICYVGIVLFLGLTAWDTQRLRLMMENLASDGVSEEDTKKYSVVGALTLYLDFINIFLFLLRLTGKRE
jgi:FtsH-binding integral membrane protein